jgi:hypothetical protein
MQEPASSETWSVESARNAVLQWTLRLVAVCGLLWWISAAVTTPVFPRSLYGTVSLVLLMIVWIAAVTPRISARWQLCAILLFCSVVNLLALVCVGLSPNNAILVFLMFLVVSLYWGIRAGWAASGAIALMIAASAFGWHRGFFPLPGFASSLDFTGREGLSLIGGSPVDHFPPRYPHATPAYVWIQPHFLPCLTIPH